MNHSLLGTLLGLALFLFPGFAWAWTLARGMGWAKAVPLGLVLAFTVAPAGLYVMNVLFNAPIRLATIAAMCVAMGMAGLALGLAGPVRAHLASA